MNIKKISIGLLILILALVVVPGASALSSYNGDHPHPITAEQAAACKACHVANNAPLDVQTCTKCHPDPYPSTPAPTTPAPTTPAPTTPIPPPAPIPTANGSISGFKINDANGNGEQDPGEAGIPDVTIRLIGIVGTGMDTKIIKKETSTDADGSYIFNDLQAGRYIVIAKHKQGFVPTSHVVMHIKLANGENSMNNDFMNRPSGSLFRKR